MTIENQTWDEICNGLTGNPFGEIEIMEMAKEEINKGNKVFLTVEGKNIFQLAYSVERDEFYKLELD